MLCNPKAGMGVEAGSELAIPGIILCSTWSCLGTKQQCKETPALCLGNSWFSNPVIGICTGLIISAGPAPCPAPCPRLDRHLPVLVTGVLHRSRSQTGTELSSAFCLPGLRHPAALPARRKGGYPSADGQMICPGLQDVAEPGREHSCTLFSIKAQLRLWDWGQS